MDYGRENDPLANVRASEEFGIPGWIGAVIRANDKMRRLQTFTRKDVLANESVRDSLLDLAVYAMIATLLYDEDAQALINTALVGTSTTPNNVVAWRVPDPD